MKATPFEVVYGRPTPHLLSYSWNFQIGYSGYSFTVALRSRDQIFSTLKTNLLHAQQKMKATFDSKHRHVEFRVGDRVLLKLQPYRKLSVATRSHQKLLTKFYGRFRIEQHIRPMAYKLEFPSSTKLHLVFQVFNLKLFHEVDIPAAATLHSSFRQELPHPNLWPCLNAGWFVTYLKP